MRETVLLPLEEGRPRVELEFIDPMLGTFLLDVGEEIEGFVAANRRTTGFWSLSHGIAGVGPRMRELLREFARYDRYIDRVCRYRGSGFPRWAWRDGKLFRAMLPPLGGLVEQGKALYVRFLPGDIWEELVGLDCYSAKSQAELKEKFACLQRLRREGWKPLSFNPRYHGKYSRRGCTSIKVIHWNGYPAPRAATPDAQLRWFLEFTGKYRDNPFDFIPGQAEYFSDSDSLIRAVVPRPKKPRYCYMFGGWDDLKRLVAALGYCQTNPPSFVSGTSDGRPFAWSVHL